MREGILDEASSVSGAVKLLSDRELTERGNRESFCKYLCATEMLVQRLEDLTKEGASSVPESGMVGLMKFTEYLFRLR